MADLSTAPGVASTTVLGTVLSVEMEGAVGYGGGGGAASVAGVVRSLRAVGVMAQPLGGVVYLLVSPMTSREAVAGLLERLDRAVRAVGKGGGS